MADEQAYEAFWQGIDDRLRAVGDFPRHRSSDPKYKSLKTGVGQVIYSLEFRSIPRRGVKACVHFEGNTAFNDKTFGYVSQFKNEIENAYGEALQWGDPNGRKKHTVGRWLYDRTIDDDQTILDATAEWMVDTVVRLRDTVVPYVRQAKGDMSSTPVGSAWDDFIRLAKRYVDTGRLEEEEVDYKLDISRRISAIRQQMLSEPPVDGWTTQLAAALGSENLVNWRVLPDFKKWLVNHSDNALNALRSLWESPMRESDVVGRFDAAASILASYLQPAARTNLISVLLMGTSAEEYPPYRYTAFKWGYERTKYPSPDQSASEGQVYQHALGFLDRFIEEAAQRDLTLQNRLEAQSVLWAISKGRAETEEDDEFQLLADSLYLPVDFIQEIVTLLEEKKQVIFQGPPGTGKTYVARALANHLAGAKDRVRLVQFHPSYAYEDFIQGYRPTLKDGQAGFALQDGPLLQSAKQAREEPDEAHYLIIDEINRGNLAKVFGELYFLLEYRDAEIRLQYSDEPFSLPTNLYIIGTMNTADRSIALVDLALRRRFAFVEFDVRQEPVKGVLRRWLGTHAPAMAWLAGVVDRANEELNDRHAAIGPSYFMQQGLTEERARRIWRHEVLPYIEERLYGEQERIGKFDFDTLRRGRTEPDTAPDDDADTAAAEEADAQ